MTKVSLFKQDGSQIGEIELNAAVFGVEPNEDVIFDAVIMQRASLRQGTHAVKNRSAVRGGGRKPWRQKGTGRARQGSIRSPQWVGGGTVFGPTPRSYSYKLPKKVRRLALQSVLSQKVLEGKLVVVDELSFAAPSTKEFKSVLNNLKVDAKTLLVLEGIKVKKVNTINVDGKAKRMGRYAGFTRKYKKAVVTLTAESKDIELFANEAE